MNDSIYADVLKTEYDIIYRYYLWSLSTRATRQTLCVALSAGVIAGISTLLASSNAQKEIICSGILLGYFLTGLALLQRQASGQTTNIWCVYRINLLRRVFRDTYGLREVFRPASMGVMRGSPDLFGLLKYRLGAQNFLMISNSIAMSAAILFILSYYGLLAFWALAILCGTALYVMELIWYRAKLNRISGYLAYDAAEFERAIQSMNDMATSTTAKGNSDERE